MFRRCVNLAAIKDNHELQQRAEKPEVGIANDGEVQSAIRPDDLNLLDQIAKNVEAELPGRVGGRNARDREARCQTKQSASAKEETGIELSSMKALSQ